MSNKFVTIHDIALMMGVCPKSLASRRHRLKGFPQPVRKEVNSYLYRLSDAQKYSDQYKEWKQGAARPKAAKANIRELSLSFLSGDMAPKYQMAQIEAKKARAKLNKPKTTTVTLTPEWMQDD